MKQERSTVMLYLDIEEAIKRLSDEAAGEVFKAIFSYVRTQEEPSFKNESSYYSFGFIRAKLDEDKDRIDEIIRKRKEAGRKGGIQRSANIANQANAKFATTEQANEANSSKSSPNPYPNPYPNPLLLSKQEKVKRERFTAPTLKETIEYFKEIGSDEAHANKFFYYYESCGWKVGKNSMKDWKAAARNASTWEVERSLFSQSPTQRTGSDRRAAGVTASDASAYEGNF